MNSDRNDTSGLLEHLSRCDVSILQAVLAWTLGRTGGQAPSILGMESFTLVEGHISYSDSNLLFVPLVPSIYAFIHIYVYY